MIYLQLFYEFFKIGLFSVGGGLAALPFLYHIAERYDWLSSSSIPDMVAISQSTPGPLGVNMSTYVGFNAAGVPGALVATFALALPSFIIIVSIARILSKFNENFYVKSAFYGLRPAVTGLIVAAGWEIFKVSIFMVDKFSVTKNLADMINLKAAILAAVLYYLIVKFDKHPIFYIAGAAVCGIIFKL